MIFPDKIYQILKWGCLIFLPALAVFYFTLSKIWGFPYGSEVTATINAIALFIGSSLGITQRNYNMKEQEKEHGES